jgi:hypothetical protein
MKTVTDFQSTQAAATLLPFRQALFLIALVCGLLTNSKASASVGDALDQAFQKARLEHSDARTSYGANPIAQRDEDRRAENDDRIRLDLREGQNLDSSVETSSSTSSEMGVYDRHDDQPIHSDQSQYEEQNELLTSGQQQANAAL